MKKTKEKRKVMFVGRNKTRINIYMVEEHLAQINEHKYLGINISNCRIWFHQVQNRNKSTTTLCHIMGHFFNKNKVSKKTKGKTYKHLYYYDNETWVTNSELNSKLQAKKMKYVVRIQGITRNRLKNKYR